MNRPVRVLFLIDELHVGGTERQLYYLLRYLDRNRYQPMVCCFRLKGQIAEDIERMGVKVTILKKRAAIDPLFLWQLVRLIRRERIQLVQTFLITANLWGGIAARLTGVRTVVASERNVIFADSRHTALAPLMLRLIGRLATKVVGNAHAVCRSLIEQVDIDPERVVCIHNGVEPLNSADPQVDRTLVREQVSNESTVVVGTIARLVPQKNIHCFLEALARLRPAFPHLKGLIVGDGPLRRELQQKAEELGITETVTFSGESSDVFEALSILDIFILSSSYEGLPNVVMEAMVAGVPVVATRVGGTPELVENGVSGLLVPPDDPGALAKAIQSLMGNRVLAEQLAQAGKRRMTTLFSVQKMVESYDNLYQSLMERASSHERRYPETDEKL